jgi:hypothetical protein
MLLEKEMCLFDRFNKKYLSGKDMYESTFPLREGSSISEHLTPKVVLYPTVFRPKIAYGAQRIVLRISMNRSFKHMLSTSEFQASKDSRD